MGSIYFLMLFSQFITIEAYTLTPSQSIIDGQTLISQGGTFELGFFSPSKSNSHRYLGIWYKAILVDRIVWVANRDSPLNDTSGVLKIGAAGNIVIVNQTESVIWTSSNSSIAVESPIIEFLESGNLVLRDGDSKSYVWQSFDYPGDTLLPGMKLGWNLKTNMNRYLSSWKNFDDPSQGDYIFETDITGYLQQVLRSESKKYYRAGPWNGVQNSGSIDMKPNEIFTYELIHNEEEIYFLYQLVNQSVIFRFTLVQTGTEAHVRRYRWVDNKSSWVSLGSSPRDRCDEYAQCGVYGTCEDTTVGVCRCLEGFKPKSPQSWSGSDWSHGCERRTSLNCTEGDGFKRFAGVKLPETIGARVNTSINLEECGVKCLKDCTCMAYSNSDIREGGSGCIMWFTELIDIRQLDNDGQDLYIRMAASELDVETGSRRKERVIMIVSITSVAGVVLISLGSWCIWKKRSPKGGSDGDDLELPMYDFLTIANATNNFSEENKLGEGGFGPVYKGKLEGEQEIAVKRLSKDSMQGVDEFKNEIILISKLQHRNLVRILGCCIQGEEKMLVYEYMPNKSLDSSIFDKTKSRLLDWEMRFHIILGIARGLVYLHHDSRLRIIHRDLKASNILLDSQMVPKISDFGMARIFAGDQLEGKTKRVVGTYGYMSPEYVFDGHFSVKSDVFSFGVLILEIISGKKNRSFCHPDHEHNLLGHAWRLWSEDKSIEFIDKSMSDSYFVGDILRCIHVGLLCVQRGTEKRPNMSSVLLMLSSGTAVLSMPQQPGFYIERSIPSIKDLFSSYKESLVADDTTLLDAR